MARGFLIALEGVDGAGKTTQAMLLAGTLARFGRRVVLTREPTSGAAGQRLQNYLAGSSRHLSALEELALFQADRREHVETAIRPALNRGWVVITDRYYYSSMAYQGALGLDPDDILAESEAFAPRPDLAIILTLPLSEAQARRLELRGEGPQVSEMPEYLERVAALYDTFQGSHLRHVQASGTEMEVLGRLLRLTLDTLASVDPEKSGEEREVTP